MTAELVPRPRPENLPPPFWRVAMADNTTRNVEALGFRVEGGALVLLRPAGCVAAFAPGTWLSVESWRP
jgi:hypothetical protein